MTSMAERIQKRISRDKAVQEAVKNTPNDFELGEQVRQLFKNEISDDRDQLSLNFNKNITDNETLLNKKKYNRTTNY